MNLSVQIGKLKLKNPVMTASGTFGYAREFEPFVPLRKLGGIVTKTLTLKPRIGNPPVRIHETPAGMINAIGLQNVGAESFIKNKLPFLKGLGIPIITSVMGRSVDEFVEVVRFLDKAEGLSGFELNLSCPNVDYASNENPAKESAVRMFAHDDRLIFEAVSAVRRVTKKTLIAKLGPDVSDISRMAKSAQEAGADAVSLINTFVAMAVDVKKRRPVLKNVTGGLSGPCIRPIAVRMVWEAYNRLRIPVIGMGGIMNARDAVEFFIAGATAIQVGTANFINPQVTMEILKGIEQYMKEEKIKNIQYLIGSLKTS